MPRRNRSNVEHESEVDLIPLMDLSLNLTFFFVVLTTLAKDEASLRVNLPVAQTSVLAEEERIPDSLNLNIDNRSYVLNWGLQINLNTDAGVAELSRLMKIEASRQKERQPDWKKSGLNTTVILRADQNVDYSTFRKVIDVCRSNGFRKFLLKARAQE
jgi:biopolymer transport protein ExbD